MEYGTLGRTNLLVSVMGLGGGGHSQLGRAQKKGDENAVQIVRRALNLGINFIDTAESYGTETAIGQALSGVDRDAVVLSTKVGPRQNDVLLTPAELTRRVDGCRERLRTDSVDILHLHGVAASDYAYCAETLVPALQTLRDAGAIRFLGITEAFIPDPSHRMLSRAIQDDCWDVMMIGFNLLNPSARETLFPTTRQKNIGVLDMFAVRRALQGGAPLRAAIQSLIAAGKLSAQDISPDDALDFLIRDEPNAAKSLPEAAYRFCRHEPGVDVVLVGTGNIAHLEANARALSGPPLPVADQEKLRQLFGRVDSVSGN